MSVKPFSSGKRVFTREFFSQVIESSYAAKCSGIRYIVLRVGEMYQLRSNFLFCSLERRGREMQ